MTGKLYSERDLVYRSCQLGRINWATEIKSLLLSLGFGYSWFSQSVGHSKLFLSEAKSRLVDHSVQNIQEKLTPFQCILSYNSISRSCRVYHQSLTVLDTKSYSLVNNSGRCNSHDVEDEDHFIFYCSSFAHQQKLFITPPPLIIQTSDKHLKCLTLDKTKYY